MAHYPPWAQNQYFHRLAQKNYFDVSNPDNRPFAQSVYAGGLDEQSISYRDAGAGGVFKTTNMVIPASSNNERKVGEVNASKPYRQGGPLVGTAATDKVTDY